MSYTQQDLNMAVRHVAEGERHVAQQERILSELRLRGQPTEIAEKLLEEFRQTLEQHKEHRDYIEASLGKKSA